MKFKHKGICKLIDIDIFCDEVIFVYDKSDECVKNFIKDTFITNDKELEELQELFDTSHPSNIAYYIYNNNIKIKLIRLKKMDNYSNFLSVLSHEVLHAVVGILTDKGIYLNNDTEEVFTYLQQYLMKQITKEFFKDE